MDNKEYWESRALAREEAAYKNALEAEKELAKYYTAMTRKIRKEIADLYARYAKDNSMTYADAMDYLTAREMYEWRMDLEDYIKKIKELEKVNPVMAKALQDELNVLAANSQIKRYDALVKMIEAETALLALKEEQATTDALKKTYEATYYNSIFDIQQGIGLATTFAILDTDMINDVLNYPWSGDNYSKDIWANRDQLSRDIRHELTNGLIRGASVREMAESIDKKAGKGYKNAERLVRTEVNYFCGAANLQSYRECGIEKYQYIATLDKRTCTVCGDWDLKIEEVEKAVPGVNFHPMHPNCRCTDAAYIEGIGSISETRIARDKDGKNIHVSGNMKYKEWYNEYVITPQKESEIREKIRSGEISTKILKGKQNKHIIGTNEYIEGRSILTADAQKIIDEYAGTGKLLFTNDGRWKEKEIVNCQYEIGIYKGLDGTMSVKTTRGNICYSKKGVHVVPVVPEEMIKK